MFGLGLLIDPLIAGYLVYYFTWKAVHLFFSISAFLGLILMVIIEILDRNEGKFRDPISMYKKVDYILIADVDNELYPIGNKSNIELEY
jgi:MFS family permease